MGNCARRAERQGDQDWILIQAPQPVPLNATSTRFRRTVRVVRRLLVLRKKWSSLRSYLNTAEGRRSPRRRQIGSLVSYLGRGALSGTARVFEHLERRSGFLVHKTHSLREARSYVVRLKNH